MGINDITVGLFKRQVIFGDVYIYNFSTTCDSELCCSGAFVLRSPPMSQTIWPGELIEVALPGDSLPNSEYALNFLTDAPTTDYGPHRV